MSDNSFVDGFILMLDKNFSKEQIRYIKDSLYTYSLGFEITPRTTELIDQYYKLPQAYYIYMATKQQDGIMSVASFRQYEMCLTDFLYYLAMPLEKITTNHIRLYLQHISKNKRTGERISENTMNQRKSIIRSFFKWLCVEEYIDKDPSLRIRDEKPKSKPRTAYKDIEIEMLRESCDNIRDKAIIDLLFSSGMRISECVNLNIGDVDFDSREVTVYGKGGKWRKVFIDSKTVVSLKRYLSSRYDDNPALFVTKRKPNERIHQSGIRKMLHGIEGTSNVDNVIPHKFRHSTATRLINKGMPLEEVQKLLGHERPTTTLRYAHVSLGKIKSDYDKYM